MKRYLKKGTLFYSVFFMLLGNGFYAFAQWLQLSFISKLSDTNNLGFYTLALGIISPLFMFSSFQLRALLVTDVQNKFRVNDLFNFRLLMNLLSILIMFVLIFFVNNKHVIVLMMLISGQKILESFSELFNSKQQKLENMNVLAFSLFLKGFMLMSSVLVSLYFFNSLVLGLVLNIFILTLIILFYDYSYYKKYNHENLFFSINKKSIKNIFFRGLPLGIVLLIISLNANIAKYFLENFEGTNIQAVYSSLSYVLIIGVFVLDALGQAFIPRLSKYFFNNEFVLLKKLSFFFIFMSSLIGGIVYLGAYFFGEEILKILFNDYIATFHVFFSNYMLVSILVFVASSLGYILTAIGEFKIQPFINGVILILNIMLSYFFIKYNGLDGTLSVLGICFSIQILITVLVISRAIKKKERYD